MTFTLLLYKLLISEHNLYPSMCGMMMSKMTNSGKSFFMLFNTIFGRLNVVTS